MFLYRRLYVSMCFYIFVHFISRAPPGWGWQRPSSPDRPAPSAAWPPCQATGAQLRDPSSERPRAPRARAGGRPGRPRREGAAPRGRPHLRAGGWRPRRPPAAASRAAAARPRGAAPARAPSAQPWPPPRTPARRSAAVRFEQKAIRI